MNIEYVARGYDLDEKLKGFAEKKIGKLAKFVEDPIEVRLTLEVEKHRQIADLHISHRGGILQGSEETVADMHEAINQVVDTVEKQARRSRKKKIDRRRRADRVATDGHHWPVEVLERESIGAAGGPRVIENTRLSVEPMSIEEAALQLESAKLEFLVFRDAQTERVSVLYKRRDDNYGLIAPEL